MAHFRPIDRETKMLLPPAVQEWVPERHLARYVVEVVESLDLSMIEQAYRGSGSAGYHPKVMLSLLIYGYATGTFSSRKPVLSLSKGSSRPPRIKSGAGSMIRCPSAPSPATSTRTTTR